MCGTSYAYLVSSIGRRVAPYQRWPSSQLPPFFAQKTTCDRSILYRLLVLLDKTLVAVYTGHEQHVR